MVSENLICHSFCAFLILLLLQIFQIVQIAENAVKYCGENSAACMRDKEGKYFSIGDINDQITI